MPLRLHNEEILRSTCREQDCVAWWQKWKGPVAGLPKMSRRGTAASTASTTQHQARIPPSARRLFTSEFPVLRRSTGLFGKLARLSQSVYFGSFPLGPCRCGGFYGQFRWRCRGVGFCPSRTFVRERV